MKCAFCGENEGEVVITDGETLQENLICYECDGLQKKIDDVIDNQIEELQLQRAGIM